MESNRTFKIRKTSKAKQFMEAQEQEYVQNLEDLRLEENQGNEQVEAEGSVNPHSEKVQTRLTPK